MEKQQFQLKQDEISQEKKRLKERYSYIKLGVFFIFVIAILISRLGYLQFVKGEAYTAMAQSQRVKTIEVNQYGRGDILDRSGEPLTNHEESCLVIFPTVVENKEVVKQVLNDYFEQKAEPIAPQNKDKKKQGKGEATVEVVTDGKETAEYYQKLAGSKAFVLARNLSDAQVSDVNRLVKEYQLKGVYVLPLKMRYAETPLACHIIGFVGEADEEEAGQLEKDGLSSRTMVGKTGVEKQYNELLQGKNSDEIGLVVDERGKQTSPELRLLKGEPPAKGMGENVVLTIDKECQEIMDQAMAGKVGGAVMLDVKTGDVLAMTSAPGFDPNQGQPSTGGDRYVNKALSYYPPASVFKLVLVLAALDHQIACPTNFVCTGSITLPNGHQVGCWYEDGHGVEDLPTALGNSCNPYFVHLGQILGGDMIKEYVYKLDLTEQKLIGYSTYSMPNNLSFNSKVPADVANVSIGEKGIRLTPLMVAQLLATIANDGKVITPRLVMGVKDADGSWIETYESAQPRQAVKEESAKALQTYLAKAVMAGTGTPVSNTVVKTAGKSGTTQNQGVWFAGFAPAESPKWAIAVYISNGSSGGKDSGGVFKEIVEKLAILEGVTN